MSSAVDTRLNSNVTAPCSVKNGPAQVTFACQHSILYSERRGKPSPQNYSVLRLNLQQRQVQIQVLKLSTLAKDEHESNYPLALHWILTESKILRLNNVDCWSRRSKGSKCEKKSCFLYSKGASVKYILHSVVFNHAYVLSKSYHLNQVKVSNCSLIVIDREEC